MPLLTDLLSANTTDIAANTAAAASATTAANNAGNMTIHTANGSSVAVGEYFLLTSTSAIPSTWSWNGSNFTVSQNGGHWIGSMNPAKSSTSFRLGQIYHGDTTTGTQSVSRVFMNSSSVSTGINVDAYLPVIMMRAL